MKNIKKQIICTGLTLFLAAQNQTIAQFSSQQVISDRVSIPQSMVAVDMDQDGDDDIIAGGYGEIAWYENTGTTFHRTKHTISAIPYPNSVTQLACADLDNDGDLDILGYSNYLNWYENLGNQNFAPAEQISSMWTFDIHLVDVDNDLDVDIVTCVDWTTNLFLIENLGAGNFGSEQAISTLANSPTSVYSMDVDVDGDMDLLSGSYGKVAWYENLGGTFGTQQMIGPLSSDYNACVRTADMDGDSDLDIVVAANDKMYWRPNLGSGNFGTQVTITLSDYTVHFSAADFDNDGDQDITAAIDSPGTGKFTWYKNLGSGTFGSEIILIDNYYDAEVCAIATDLDLDGNTDIAFAEGAHSLLGYFKNTGLGYFESEEAIAPNHEDPTSGFAADLDNDGDKEIIIASDVDDRIGFYENLGGGQFSELYVITNFANGASGVSADDLDGDGDMDITVSCHVNNQILWYKNLGGLSFSSAYTLSSTATLANSVYTDDLDSDGDVDVFFSCSNKIAWCKNLGGGAFGPQQNISTLINNGQDVFACDLDGDGNRDLLAASAYDNKVTWYKNLGSGTFGPQQIISNTSNYANNVCAGDLDGDGDADVAVASGDGQFLWYPNSGTGIFSAPQTLFTMSSYSDPKNCISLIDMDNDGDVDPVIAGTNNIIYWFENLGGGNFSSPHTIGTGPFSEFIHLSDIDNDGDADVLTGDIEASQISWYKNYLFNEYLAKGQLYYDENQNGQMDISEQGLSSIHVLTNPANGSIFSYANGTYIINFDDTTNSLFELYPEPPLYWGITSDSLSYHVLIDSTSVYCDSLDFGFFPDTLVNAVNAQLVGGFPSCNQHINYWINIQNIGTTTPHGNIHLELDNEVSFVSSSVVPDSIVGQNIYWHFDSLFYFENELINIEVIMPDFTSMGDTLSSYLTASASDNLATPLSIATNMLEQILVCAYDPNDKIATPAGYDTPGYIADDTPYLDYTIRFQNTGTAVATDIVVKDQLDPNLDWSTLTPLAFSHPMTIFVGSGGLAEFTFENIMLPDSGANELASHGFVKFRINLLSGLASGTIIQNTGAIYFDANPPVITNTKINTIENCTDLFSGLTHTTSACEGDIFTAEIVNSSGASYLWIFNDMDSLTGTNISWPQSGSSTEIMLYSNGIVCSGDSLISFTVYELPLVTINDFSDDTVCIGANVIDITSSPAGGIYGGPGVSGNQINPAIAGPGLHQVTYYYTDMNGCTSSDSIEFFVTDCLGFEESAIHLVSIYPNPASNYTTLFLDQNLIGNYTIYLNDLLGRLIYSQPSFNGNKIDLSKFYLEPAAYILTIVNNDTKANVRIKLVIN